METELRTNPRHADSSSTRTVERLSINVTTCCRTFERFCPALGREAVVIVGDTRRVGGRSALLNSAGCPWPVD